jgi:hypothetical protein
VQYDNSAGRKVCFEKFTCKLPTERVASNLFLSPAKECMMMYTGSLNVGCQGTRVGCPWVMAKFYTRKVEV